MRRRPAASPIAHQMKQWRDQHGLTQKQAAQLLLTAPNQWARWERGTVIPDPAWLSRIETLLEGFEETSAAPLPIHLLHFRRTYALRQTEAAARIGVSRRTWQAWESGARTPGKVWHYRIWRFLDAAERPFRRPDDR